MERQKKTDFSRKILQLMGDKDLTQAELARRAGIGRDNITGYIRGRCLPRASHLKAIAEALNVQPDTLLEGRVFESPKEEPKADEFFAKIEQRGTDPSHVLLHVRQLVTMKQALQVMAALNEGPGRGGGERINARARQTVEGEAV